MVENTTTTITKESERSTTINLKKSKLAGIIIVSVVCGVLLITLIIVFILKTNTRNKLYK
jgi:hypothetical protein